MAGFERVLGFKVILLITITSIIGTGIFFLPAIGAGLSGPSSLIGWVLLGIVSIYTAMCFSEMASMFPKAGGIYEFTRKAYGPFTSFLMGWILWLINNITTAMLIVGAIQYILPGSSPEIMMLKFIICIIWVILFNYIAYKGMKASSVMLVVFSLITLFIILLLIFSGLFHFDIDKLNPFFIYEGFMNIPFIILTIFFISETFFGIESVLCLSEEAKNPQKTIPKAIITGVICVVLLSLALVTISLGVINYSDFASSPAPFAELASVTLGGYGKDIIVLGTYLVIMGAAASWIVSGPRLIVSLSQNHMFPPKFAELHPNYSSPYNAIKFQAAATITFIIIAFIGSGYHTLISMLIPFEFLMLSIGLSTLLILRKKKPSLERHYKVKAPFIGIPIIIFMNLSLILVWLIKEHDAGKLFLMCISSIMLGIPLFFFLQAQYNPRSIEKINDKFAYIQLIFENILIPNKIKEKIYNTIRPDIKKPIFELGCSVGGLTLFLREKYKNKIYATDISLRCIEIARKRISEKGFKDIILKHNKNQSEEIGKDIPDLSAVISISALGYIKKIDSVLSDINKRLETGDQICFVEYDKILYLISNITWLKSDALIRHIFRRNGFLVEIERIQYPLWQYIFIHGKKVIESYQPEFDNSDKKLIHTKLQPLDNLKNYMKEKLSSFEADILDKRLSLVLQTDKELDNHPMHVNYHYFEEMIEYLYKIIIKFSIDNKNILIRISDVGNKLRIRYSFQFSEEIESFLLNLNKKNDIDEAEMKSGTKELKRLIEIKKMITQGYEGHFNISKSHSLKNPLTQKEMHTFILGSFDDKQFSINDEEYITIEIIIPLIILK